MKQNEIKILLGGLKYFYPTYFGEEPHKIGNIFEYKGKEYSKSWIISETFRIAEIPENESDIGAAIRKLEGIYTSPESESPAANMPGKEVLERSQADETIAKVKEIQKRIKEEEAGSIKKRQEIYAKTKIEKPDLPEEQKKAAEVIVEEIKNAPTQEAINLVKDQIKERVPEVEEETANITASVIVINVQKNYSPAVEEKIVEKPDLATILSDQSKSLTELKDLTSLTQNVAKLAYGEEGQKVLLPKVAIEEVSDTPSPGFVPIQIPAIYKTTESATETKVVTFGRSWVQTQLAGIGEGNIQGTNYNPNRLQSSFSAFKPLVGFAKNAAINKVKSLAVKSAVGAVTKATAPETAGLSLIVGEVINKAVDALSKVQRWLKENNLAELVPALLAGGLVFPFFGLPGSIGVVLPTYLGLKGFNSTPAGRAAFGRGVGIFFGALGGATLGAIGPPILFTLLGFPIIVALILFIINSGAYVVPPAPELVSGTQNPYIDVTKAANPPGPFENSSLPLKISYTITISAKKEDLTNVSFTNDCNVTTKAGNQKCTAPTVEVPNGTVAVGRPFTFTYDANYNSSYKDSFVTDTVTVTANALSQSKPQKADASASIKIGNPPEECPSIWPTNHGIVTQGAYTSSSHALLEAIDIGVSHVGVMATHTGNVVHAQTDSCYGNNIEVKSTCAGKTFVSRYAHLEGIKVKVGQTVTAGQPIGLSGNTTGGKPSCSTGAHLHYDFDYWPGVIPTKYPNNPPFMMKPYIPQNVKRGCVDNCGVTW